MMRGNTVVMAIDPGEDCGWTIGVGHEVEKYGKDNWKGFLEKLELALASGVVERVVSERIDPRRWDNDLKLTVGVAFTCRWLTERQGIPFAEVNAADKRKTLLDVIPEITGHARDAEAIRLWDLRYGRW